jgi:hypothetical protein
VLDRGAESVEIELGPEARTAEDGIASCKNRLIALPGPSTENAALWPTFSGRPETRPLKVARSIQAESNADETVAGSRYDHPPA